MLKMVIYFSHAARTEAAWGAAVCQTDLSGGLWLTGF